MSKSVNLRLCFVVFLALIISYIFSVPIFNSESTVVEPLSGSSFFARYAAAVRTAPFVGAERGGGIDGWNGQGQNDIGYSSRDFKFGNVEDYIETDETYFVTPPWEERIVRHVIGEMRGNDPSYASDALLGAAIVSSQSETQIRMNTDNFD
ncbi:MAG: hypothetical protein FWH55_11175 [Oscillospiraceae bacterium]|nr:hypothetical protein [Oscillospiraceae bacterium]